MKKYYLEPEMEIVKFSFSDSILEIKLSDQGSVIEGDDESSVNQREDGLD